MTTIEMRGNERGKWGGGSLWILVVGKVQVGRGSGIYRMGGEKLGGCHDFTK